MLPLLQDTHFPRCLLPPQYIAFDCFDWNWISQTSWMFNSASSFNQDIAGWNTASVEIVRKWKIDRTILIGWFLSNLMLYSSNSLLWITFCILVLPGGITVVCCNLPWTSQMVQMFLDASSVNQNLCSWGSDLNADAGVAEMFVNTKCPSELTPNMESSPRGPFCHVCISIPSPTPSTVDKPKGCFSADSTAWVFGKRMIAMKDLIIGDRVLVEKDTYEPVYAFGHKNNTI